MKNRIIRKKLLRELAKISDEPQRRASRYRTTMWIWIVAGVAALAGCILCQEGGDPSHHDAPFAFVCGLCAGMVFFYKSASRQAVIIASVLDREKIKESLEALDAPSAHESS